MKKELNRLQAVLQKNGVDTTRLPVHVAIIMDGNGRWAERRGLPRAYGHRKGVERLCDITRMSSDIGIKVLTLYAFSTENWKRPFEEIDCLMDLLVEFLRKKTEELHENGVIIRTLGNCSQLPGRAQDELELSIDKTRQNTGMILNLALNYGGRSEIVASVKKICSGVMEGSIRLEDIDEMKFSDHLYTGGLPDPDVVIRTGGEYRLSNFLLYQAAYSEMIFAKPLWPDFDENEYAKALKEFQNRKRKYGAI
ncbi:MAG: isoprenyl transferase [Bacillota bacterium]|nr:isoprenyl transferase [Bacillota bacterium]